MGIFGNKQQDDSGYQDQPVDNQPIDPAVQPQSGSIDGVVQANDQPLDDFTGQGVPPVDDQTVEDTGSSYIMADPVNPDDNWGDNTQTEQPSDNHYVEGESPAADSSPQDGQDFTQPPEQTPAPEDNPSSDSGSMAGNSDNLEEIRSQALKELSPLISHLEQSPEERFHTAMMMLQATDDHSLVKTAYQAAQEITDEKTKAQALLDIVNEINYFTKNKAS